MKKTINIKRISNEGISTLKDESFKIKSITDDEIDVKINNEKDFKTLIKILSVLITNKKIEDSFHKNLRKNFSKENREKIIDNHKTMTNELTYFNVLTHYNLLDYFEDNDTININAFLRFNLKEASEELLYISKMEIQCSGNYVDMLNNPDDDYPSEETDLSELDNENDLPVQAFEAIIIKLREIYVGKYEGKQMVKDLHIFEQDGKILVASEHRHIINPTFFASVLGASYKVEMPPEYPQYVTEVMNLMIAIAILRVNRVILYNISDEKKNYIHYNLFEYNKITESPYKIYNSEKDEPEL